MRFSDAAIAYASAGWRVFPLQPGGKTPATSNGFRNATTDIEQVNRWWKRTPDANIGIACGASSLAVVDVDRDHGGLETLWHLIRAGWDFPPTLSQVTPSDGVHYLYETPDWELRNTAGKLPGIPDRTPGIDLRASGGYIVVTPSETDKGAYEWLSNWMDEPAPSPDWLRPGLKEPANLELLLETPTALKYAEAALVAECETVRTAPLGTRNNQLNESAFKIFTLVATGSLDETLVVSELAGAAQANGLDASEIRSTIRSASEAGRRRPRNTRHG